MRSGGVSGRPAEARPSGPSAPSPCAPPYEVGLTATPETVADIRRLGYRYAGTDTSATLDAALLAAGQRSLTATIELACHLP